MFILYEQIKIIAEKYEDQLEQAYQQYRNDEEGMTKKTLIKAAVFNEVRIGDFKVYMALREIK